MRAICVRGRHFNGRQPSDLIEIISVIRLWNKSSSGGGGGAYAWDKSASAGLCAKCRGAYVQGGEYLRDTTVFLV